MAKTLIRWTVSPAWVELSKDGGSCEDVKSRIAKAHGVFS